MLYCIVVKSYYEPRMAVRYVGTVPSIFAKKYGTLVRRTAEREGARGTMTRGSMDFSGPIVASVDPWAREEAHRNGTEKLASGALKTFFFWDHLHSAGKPLEFRWRPFFFGDHMTFRTKLQDFLRLFWTSQNQKSVKFELVPGPRLALGAPAGAVSLFCNGTDTVRWYGTFFLLWYGYGTLVRCLS